MLLSAEHICKNYGMKQLLNDVSLYLNEKDKIGIVGINGTGKSTLLRILAGVEYPDSGTVSLNPNVQISYLAQNPEMEEENTVLEQVFSDFSPEKRTLNEYEVKAMLTKLGISDYEAKIKTLSGGQRKRVALAAALIHPSDILMLDEPTNHLDSEMVEWLEQKLIHFNGGIIMITHDRYFLENISTKITELSRGTIYNYEANYSKYLALKAQRCEMEEAGERKRQAVLRREYQWISRGARARSTKSRDRIERYNDLKSKSAPETDDTVQISTMSSRLGKKLIELKNISKAYGDKKIINDFSYNLKRNDRIGIVGRNGAGKSTLLNMIAGRLEPDSGEVDIGSTVRIGYFTQESNELDKEQRVYDFINDTAREIKTDEGIFSSSQMLEKFLFTSDMQRSKIGALSGGERRRLFLLSILISAPNVLVLDEPTNDLDIETLTILEDYLETFTGAVITVSHDRYFLDKIATAIFEVDGVGGVTEYSGNYTDYHYKRNESEKSAIKQKDITQAENRKKKGTASQKLKFSFNEQQEYKTIDDDIAKIEREITETEQGIEKAASDYIKLEELMNQKTQLEAELEKKTERWMYLNELAEKIEAQNK